MDRAEKLISQDYFVPTSINLTNNSNLCYYYNGNNMCFIVYQMEHINF